MPPSPRRDGGDGKQPQLQHDPYDPPAAASAQRSQGQVASEPVTESQIEYGDVPPLKYSDALPSYSQLLFWHSVALLPALVLILAFALLAFKIPCRLPAESMTSSVHGDHGNDGHEQHVRQRCHAYLGPGSSLGWSIFFLAVFAYAAVHTFRTALSQACAVAFRLVQYTRPRGSRGRVAAAPFNSSSSATSKATIIFACLGRAFFSETAKVGLVILATALVYASSALQARTRSSLLAAAATPHLFDGPQWTILDSHDPRLRIAAWLALGWATADLTRGAAQLFRQLAMYAPVYLADGDELRDGGNGDGDEADDGDGGLVWIKSPPAPSKHVEAHIVSPYGSAYSRAHIHGSSRLARISADRGESDSIYRGQEDGDVAANGGAVSPSLSDSDEEPDARRRASTSDVPASTGSLSPSSPQPHAGTGTSDKQYFPALASAAPRPFAHARSNADSDSDSDSDSHSTTSTSSSSSSSSSLLFAELTALESQIDRLVAARTRARLEQQLGISLPELPPALAALWRLDSALWAIGGVLLLSGGVALAQGAAVSWPSALQPRIPPLLPTYAALVVLHAGFNSLWAIALPARPPRGRACGWAAVTYSSLLAGMAILVAALARWGLVV